MVLAVFHRILRWSKIPLVVAVIILSLSTCGTSAHRSTLYLRPVLCVWIKGNPEPCTPSVLPRQDSPASNVVLPFGPWESSLNTRYAHYLGPADATATIISHVTIGPIPGPHPISGLKWRIYLAFTNTGLQTMQRLSYIRTRVKPSLPQDTTGEAFDLNGVIIAIPQFPWAWSGNLVVLQADYTKKVAKQLAAEIMKARQERD